MPTSRSKNALYRLALPFLSPRAPGHPLSGREGHDLAFPEALEKLIRKHHITGGAFLFRESDASAMAFSASFHARVSASSTVYYRVASVTKMATALLCFRLSDQGLLDLSAPLSAYLPEAESLPDLRGVRITHLLSHTSGLADPPALESLLLRRAPFPEAVSGARVSEPGSAFRYSNLGFGLLGCVFESILDLPLGQIYQQYLFEPLEMNASIEGCRLPQGSIMPVSRLLPWHEGSALTVPELGRIPLESPDPLTHYAHSAGSMYTDLPSLEKLLLHIRDRDQSLPSSSASMRTKQAEYGALSPTLSYGSGLLIIRDPRLSSGPVYGHQGFAYGCVDGAFWEEETGRIMISLNGGCSEARTGRLGLSNFDLCRYAFRKELPAWN